MPIIGSNILAGASGQAGVSVDSGTYTGKSCIFNGSSDFLNKTWGSAASDLDKFTISMWIKRNNVDSGSTQYWLVGSLSGGESNIRIQADKIYVHLTGSNYDFVGSRLLRDTNNWYHLVFRYDSDEGSAGDRFRCYINGELETWSSSSTIPSTTDNQFFANTNQITIGAYDASNHRFKGYMAQVVALDGQSLAPTSFAETSDDTGAWIMKEPLTGLTFGDNGFLLEFKQTGTGTAGSTTIGADTSGETNHLTSNNFASADSAIPDTPVDNHATWSAIHKYGGSGCAAVEGLFEGNKEWQGPNGGGQNIGVSSLSVNASQDTFVEFKITADGAASAIGIIPIEEFAIFESSQPSLYGGATAQAYYSDDGEFYSNNDGGSSYGDTWTTNDVIGIRLNNGSLFFYKNGTIQNSGTAAKTSLTGDWLFACTGESGTDVTVRVNSGDWTNEPSGITSSNQWSSANLPDPDIGTTDTTRGNDYVNSLSYSGNGSDGARVISGVGFTSGMVWQKIRAGTDQGFGVWDIARSFGAGEALDIQDDKAEGTWNGASSSQYGDVTAVGSDTITVNDGSSASSGGYVNHSGRSYMLYAFKAGTSFTNNSGTNSATITTTGQHNADSKFAVFTYSGNNTDNAKIFHPLEAVPDFLVVKRRDSDGGWYVYHSANTSAPETEYLRWNLTDATTDSDATWSHDAPTSTLITLKDNDACNGSGATYVAYAWANGDSFSSGYYEGNGNADGPRIYCPFRPQIVITKRTDSADNWRLVDTTRSSDNDGSTIGFKMNAGDAEADAGNRNIDMLSNGFKIRDTDVDTNASSGDYIWCAWSHTPFKYGNAF